MDATAQGVSERCLGCHKEVLEQRWYQRPSMPVKMAHGEHLAEGMLCTDCHRGVVHEGVTPGTNRPKKADCSPCHLREMREGRDCLHCHYITLVRKGGL